MQQLDTWKWDQGLCGQANTGRCLELECAEADGDMSYKPPKTLLLPFEVHTSLENPILYITAFFSFAFTLLFIPMSSPKPYLQNAVSRTQTSLSSLRRSSEHVDSLLWKAQTPIISQHPNTLLDYRMVTSKQLQSFWTSSFKKLPVKLKHFPGMT